MIICVRFCGRRPTAQAPPRTGAARRVAGRGRRLHRGSGRGWSSWRDVGRGTSSRARPSAGEAIARPPRGAARRLAGRDAVIESLREAGPHWRAAGRRPSSWPRPSAGGAGTIESSVSISRVAILLGSATTCSTRVSSATDSSYAVTRRRAPKTRTRFAKLKFPHAAAGEATEDDDTAN